MIIDMLDLQLVVINSKVLFKPVKKIAKKQTKQSRK